MKLSLGGREMRKTILRCWKICLTILLLGWLIGGTAPGHANGGKSMVSSSWFERTLHGPTFRNVKDFGARGDGVTDDTAAIQRAIDFERGVQYEKKPAFVYLPAGRYVVSDTLILWKWTHLVGEAKHPSTIDLAPQAPGFGDPRNKKPVIVTCNGHNIDPQTQQWATSTASHPDAGGSANNTFYTQIRNLVVEIGAGNSGAVGILWRVAQGTCLRNLRIAAGEGAIGLDIGGDVDYAAYDEPPSQAGGGVIEDVQIVGGEIGLRGCGSQWLFRSVHVRGQRKIGVQISNCWNFDFVDLRVEQVPVGMELKRSMFALLLDSRFRDIGQGAAIVTDGGVPFYLENISAEGVEWVVDRELKGNPHGETRVGAWFRGRGAVGDKELPSGAAQPLRRKPIPLVPRPPLEDGKGQIVNVLDFGATGDGVADDTQALQRAVEAARTVFLPFGTYKVGDTIRLRRDTRLFGECLSTILLAENAEGFNDPEHPKPVILTPDEARAEVVLADLSISSGKGNRGAVLLDWCSGGMGAWDVFLYEPGEVKHHMRLRGHGGGVFSDMWNPGTKNEAGFFGASSGPAWFFNTPFEHHSRIAYHLQGARNYTFICAQTEQSPTAVLLEGCQNITLYGTVFTYWQEMRDRLVCVADSREIMIVGLNVHNSEQVLVVTEKGATTVRYPGGHGWHHLTWWGSRDG